MPGIHVRTFGKSGWVEREKEPTLTVPGSYWLCCKQNIYKFTFKHHKTMREKTFAYHRELMKVVRKIIKLHPRQGQQFCTRHLLVTYNQSSWTRQDKMFALLKFRDRPEATAYPHAFILTIKVTHLEPLERSFNNAVRSPRLQSPAIDEISTDSSTRLSPTTTPTRKRSGSPLKRSSPSKKLRSEAFLDALSLPLDQYIYDQKETIEHPAPDIAPDLINDIQETVDMPYQYLIEREIEKTKAKIERSKKTNSLEGTRSSETVKQLEFETQNNEITSSRTKGRSNSVSLGDSSTAKSADITDLVMGGLMFTIRQDADTVTVVEQKTKFEPDEVLENSEKIEGKRGECLVNSSLMKLENLITKIEMAAGDRMTGEGSDELGNNGETGHGESVIEDVKSNEINQEETDTDARVPSPTILHADGETVENSSESNGRTEDEHIIPETLQANNNNNDALPESPKFDSEIRVPSPMMDDLDNSPDSKSRARIVSNELVRIDLSKLRSAKARRLTYDQESLDNPMSDIQETSNLSQRNVLPGDKQEVRINLLKFVTDMTMGVRVVVQRLDIGALSNFRNNQVFSHECV